MAGDLLTYAHPALETPEEKNAGFSNLEWGGGGNL